MITIFKLRVETFLKFELMMEGNKCEICDSMKTTSCKICGSVFYCSENHKKKDWVAHKDKCKPYKIGKSDKLGRYMLASKDLEAGEVILIELPLVVGPRMNSNILCLGCYKVLSRNFVLCKRCEIAPVCNANCESKPHHSSYECEYYQKNLRNKVRNDFIKSNFQLVMPLKCLIIKKLCDKTGLWENFSKLESHLEDRKSDAVWSYYEDQIIKILHSSKLLDKKDFLLMQEICGILDVNSFEIRCPKSDDFLCHEQLRGVYAEAAFMSHDCIGNTFVSIDENFEMTIRTSVPIKAGEAILYNYANPFESTVSRIQRLRKGKYFNCDCKRCTDSTELGTYSGSITCPRCFVGYLIPNNPLSISTKWHCEKCNHEFYGQLVKATISEGQNLVEQTDATDTMQLEKLLIKCSKNFPPLNVIMIDIKQKLVASMREVVLREPNPRKNILSKVINLCQEILNFLEVIEPGISRHKGIIFYELYKPMLIMCKKAYESNEISQKEFFYELQECEKTLKRSIEILVYEPQKSPEGQLFKLAVKELRDLRNEIGNVVLLSKK